MSLQYTAEGAADFERRLAERPQRDLPPDAEVTRACPSPTGRPHIGTAMQAILDYAVARRTGGRFLLRIEDTDQARLQAGSLEEISDALKWLELPADEGPGIGGDFGPYVQSERLELYQGAAAHLVEGGHAYYCFCSPERLTALREQQTASGQPPMYDRHCRSLATSDARVRIEGGEKPVVRMIVPLDGEITFTDLGRGASRFEARVIDDAVILKADGFPTYHLAVVVDDHLMGVTAMVRGEEWVSSTPKHVLLYQAFGWTMPKLTHTPLLRDVDGRKLSKRAGDWSLFGGFRDHGYLPEALINFVTRTIWVHPDDTDVYPYEDFVQHFRLEQLGHSAPVADLSRLDFINGHYVRALTPEQLFAEVSALVDRLVQREEDVELIVGKKGGGHDRVLIGSQQLRAFKSAFQADHEVTFAVLGLEPERFVRLTDVILQTPIFFAALFEPAPQALLLDAAKDASAATRLLQGYVDAGLSTADDAETWEKGVRALADEQEIKPKLAFMTLRVALTGTKQSPPLHPILRIIGVDESDRRIALAVANLAN